MSTRTTSVSNPSQGVSVGLLTKTGLGITLMSFVGAIVDLAAGNTFDADTRTLITGGVASAIATILARGYQAGQKIAHQHGIDLPDQPLR